MQLRKIVATALGAIMTGATLFGPALAADLSKLPEPFVVGKEPDFIIVVGKDAKMEDMVGAIDIAATFGGYPGEMVPVPGVPAAVSVTGGKQIKTAAENLHLGDSFNAVKASVTKEDLTILGGGKVIQEDTKEISYTEKISLGSQSVGFNRDFTDATEPKLNIKFPSGTTAYTYKVIFSTGLDPEQIEGKTIKLLGTEYIFSHDDTQLTTQLLTLYGGGEEIALKPGEVKTVTIAGEDHTVELVGISSDTAATIKVDGISKDIVEGGYVTVGVTNVYVKAIRMYQVPERTGDVVLFLGADQLVFEHGVGVTKGTTPLDGSSVTITNTTDKIYVLEVGYAPTDDKYILEGESFEDPIFGAFEIKLGGIAPEKAAATKGKIELKKSGTNKVKLVFTNKADDTVSLDIMKISDSTVELKEGARDIWVEDKFVNATEGIDIKEGDYFLVSQSEYSHIIQFVDMDTTNNQIILKDIGTGETFKADFAYGKIVIGEYEYEFEYDTTNKKIGVDMLGNGLETPAYGAAADLVELYTKEGAMIELSDTMVNITEETFTGTNVPSPVEITLTVSGDTGEIKDIVPTGVTMLTKDDTDMSYGLTLGGTYVTRNSDTEVVEIYTSEEPAEALVAIGPAPVITIGKPVEAGEYKEVAPIKVSVGKLDSDIAGQEAEQKNLILVGGPCANTVVASLAAVKEDVLTCDEWLDPEMGMEGKAIVQLVEDAFTEGQYALIVAGYAKEDTMRAAGEVQKMAFGAVTKVEV